MNQEKYYHNKKIIKETFFLNQKKIDYIFFSRNIIMHAT